MEEEAIFFLLQAAQPHHELRSAFTRGSIRGWIYLEATMNNALSGLLKSVPGLIRTKTGVIRDGIEFSDWTKLLIMRDYGSSPSVGDWVRVCRGWYKGDVGYVSSVENWGGVSLLLVPRLPPRPHEAGSSSGKRKRPTRTDPTMIDWHSLRETHGVTPAFQEDGSCSLFGRRFEKGLERRTFDLHSVSLSSVSMPSDTFFIFRNSLHPDIVRAAFPCPAEWKFYEGERVSVLPSEKRGIIKAIGARSAEVDLETREGLVNVPWFDLRKCITTGDFAEVTSGPLQGEKGWVTAVEDDMVEVTERVEQETVFSNVLRVGIHPNLLISH
jgi:hypothetical protein